MSFVLVGQLKGRLKDGSVVAIKVLSIEIESMRGEREFISVLAALSNVKHENLVKLRGCGVDGATRFLVYDCMENKNIVHTFLGGEQDRSRFIWTHRRDILLGIARGLAYLHEEVNPHIVHRDIKARNILLDQNFIPKVADFGLAWLFRENTWYIGTRVAGTLQVESLVPLHFANKIFLRFQSFFGILLLMGVYFNHNSTRGYLSPEYAMSGHLTRKSDVYSFGVLLLEIVSGRSMVAFDMERREQFLVDKSWEMYNANNLLQLVDPVLKGDFSKENVWFLKVGLLCVQETSKLDPRMSKAIKMLKNEIDTEHSKISQPGFVADLMDVQVGHSGIHSSHSFSPL